MINKMKMKSLVMIGIILLFITLSFPMMTTAQTSTTQKMTIPPDIKSKLGNAMFIELQETSESKHIDSIIAFDYEAGPDSFERMQQVVVNLNITRNFNSFRMFQAYLSPSQVFELAELPYVKHIENNTCEYGYTMNTARDYTHVDWLTGEYPNLDGDKDGSKTSYSKDDIVIAVLDSGVDITHYDLDDNKVIHWEDLINHQPNPYDDHPGGHGTHCCSVAAGTGDADSRYRGVARYAALVVVKMGTPYTIYRADAIAALEWVSDNRFQFGIEIVSCSWGLTPTGESDNLAAAADLLVTNDDLVVCVAAGNEGPTEKTIRTPGMAEHVITVGAALDPGEGGWELCSYSSRGLTIDNRMKPDILAPTDLMSAKKGTYNQYEEFSGTSAATPFIAGLVGLWLDYDYNLRYNSYPDYHPAVKHLLMASAVDMPDDPNPGKDKHFGAGRIDAWDEIWFINRDVSSYYFNAPLVLDYSWNDQHYYRYDEPLWIKDHAVGNDWYKFNCYSGIFMWVDADGDPDLVLRVWLYNKYRNLITSSYPGNHKCVGHTATYSGMYYVKITVEDYSGDYYDIHITTTLS